jgi:predicted RNase H-like HicB family nuclease
MNNNLYLIAIIIQNGSEIEGRDSQYFVLVCTLPDMFSHPKTLNITNLCFIPVDNS